MQAQMWTDVTDTYITNADLLSSDGWTRTQSTGTVNANCGALGTTSVNGHTATTDENHPAEAGCFAFSARWDTSIGAWSQTLSSLPAGEYVLTFDVQNANKNSTEYNSTSYTYVEVGSTKYYDKEMRVKELKGASSWKTHQIPFVISSTSNATLSFGYQNNDNKNTSPSAFVCNLKLMKRDLQTALVNADFNSSSHSDLIVSDKEGEKAWNISTIVGDKYLPDGWYGTKESNSGMGVFSYGSTVTMNGSTVPARDGREEGDKVLSLGAAWSGNASVYQFVSLPAGSYTLTYDIAAATTLGGTNTSGVYLDGVNLVSDVKLPASVNAWETQEYKVKLATDAVVEVRLSYQAIDDGSGKQARLFFDNVTLTKDLVVDKTDLIAAIALAEATYDENGNDASVLQAAINTAKGVNTDDEATDPQVIQATNTLLEAVAAYNDANAWWTDGTEYYLYNVEAGQFLTAGENWGTKASVGGSVKLGFTRKAGTQNVYTISTNSAYSGKYLGSNGFMDSGSAEWTFEKVAGQDGVYTLQTDDKYLTKEALTKGVSPAAEITEGYSYWKVFTKETLLAYAQANATESKPVNITALMTNPDLYTLNGNGWTNAGTVGGETTHDGRAKFVAMEQWHKSLKVYQTLTDMPDGKYKLTVQGFKQQDDTKTADDGYIYINGTKVSMQSKDSETPDGDYSGNDLQKGAAAIHDGYYKNNEVTANVVSGTLEVGVEDQATVWVVFNNFQLYYLGSFDHDDVWLVLDEQKSELIDEAMNKDVYLAQIGADSDWEEAADNATTNEEVKAAFNAREAAIAAAQASATAYAKLKTAIDEASEYYVNNTFAGADDYEAAIVATETKYNAGAYTDAEVPAAIEALAAAKVAYICSQAASFDAAADYTGLMVNPSFETGDLTGWTYVAGIGGDNGVKENSNAVYTMSNVNGSYLFNTYNGDKNEKRYGIYQSVKAPKTGWYSLSVVAGSDAGNKITLTLGATSATIDAAQNVMGTETVVDSETSEETEQEVVKTQAKAIGVCGETTKVYFTEGDEMLVKVNSTTWFKADDFRLAYYGDGAKATMVVTAAKYGTFIAPFEVTVPEGVTASTVTGNEGSTLTLTSVGTTIPANTPVVLYSETEVSEDFYGVEVEATNDLKVGMLTGTYKEISAPEGSYVLQNHDGRVGFYLVGETQPAVKANRAYLTVSAETEVREFFLFEGDMETGIAAAKGAEAGNEVIYDLAGRRVSNARKGGIYIVNGKKVMK